MAYKWEQRRGGETSTCNNREGFPGSEPSDELTGVGGRADGNISQPEGTESAKKGRESLPSPLGEELRYQSGWNQLCEKTFCGEQGQEVSKSGVNAGRWEPGSVGESRRAGAFHSCQAGKAVCSAWSFSLNNALHTLTVWLGAQRTLSEWLRRPDEESMDS